MTIQIPNYLYFQYPNVSNNNLIILIINNNMRQYDNNKNNNLIKILRIKRKLNKKEIKRKNPINNYK